MQMDITMPSLGADMTEGTLIEWQVSPGDKLDKGDIIAVIETQKGAIDMEVYYPGVVTELLVQPVVNLPVGSVMARMEIDSAAADSIENEGSAGSAEITASEGAEVVVAERIPEQVPEEPRPMSRYQPSRPLASPCVRKQVKEQGLDLTGINGTGPEGAVLLRDLKSASSADVATAKTPAESMRAAIAAAMEKSKREIPHYYLSLDIDISQAQAYLQQCNENREPEQRILLLALLLKAIAAALKKFPQLNGFYQQQFKPSDAIHIGNVISLRQGGLMVPAIHDVDQQDVDTLMIALRDISNRSRSGHLRSRELSDATITVTSMGERGADQVWGVIYPPQVAVVGIGRVREGVVARQGQAQVTELLTLTLSADHRVSDGIAGAKFLNTVSHLLQKPEAL